MKLLVYAQLPVALAKWLRDRGCDVMHTTELPQGNKTPDTTLSGLADEQGRVLVTKDADFVDSHLLRGQPENLLLVSTGNITNLELIRLFESSFDSLIDVCRTNAFVELSKTGITVRR